MGEQCMIPGNNKMLLRKVLVVSPKVDLIFVTTKRWFICREDLLDTELVVFQDSHHEFSFPKKSIQWIENRYVQYAGLKIGKINGIRHPLNREKSHYTLLDLKRNIVKTHHQCLSYYLENLVIFLKTRATEKGWITHHDHIQIMIAEIIVHLKSIDSALTNDWSWAMVQQELKMASQLLAKLGGGRSFLHDNIIELIVIFDHIYNVYFED
jgi:hypothetical protein